MIASVPPSRKSASHRNYLLFGLSVALVSTCGWSQTQLGTVFGTITDPTGALIAGAQVTVASVSTGLKRDAVSDMKGHYQVMGLPTGKYTVRIDNEGFQAEIREGIVISAAAAIAINLTLQVGTVPQQVTASADVPTIDSTTSTVTTAISERSLTELPLNGRDLFKAVTLESGVAATPSSAPSLLSDGKTGQVSINGMRPSWTNVLIDGMDANDPVFGFSPAGVSGLFLGLDEFAEVRVLTQTFNVDYGRNGGGVIEGITKSGSTQLHGSLFELHRDATLEGKNYFDLADRPIPQFVRNQFGASIGGPLVHDRTFFFVSYEGFREVQAATAIDVNYLGREVDEGFERIKAAYGPEKYARLVALKTSLF